MADVLMRIEVDASRTYEDFIVKMNEIGFASRYQMSQVVSPVHEFRDEFIDHITEHGLTSLLSYSIAMEDVTSPGMSVDDVEATVSRFIDKLRPIKRLLVIDPYFYANSTSAHGLLQRLLSPHQADLNEVTVVCNNVNAPNAGNMRTAINTAAPDVTINEIQNSDFHDRFWINPDSECGIVMGTSLNGIGRKIALVDRLGSSDVQEVLRQASAVGYAG